LFYFKFRRNNEFYSILQGGHTAPALETIAANRFHLLNEFIHRLKSIATAAESGGGGGTAKKPASAIPSNICSVCRTHRGTHSVGALPAICNDVICRESAHRWTGRGPLEPMYVNKRKFNTERRARAECMEELAHVRAQLEEARHLLSVSTLRESKMRDEIVISRRAAADATRDFIELERRCNSAARSANRRNNNKRGNTRRHNNK
jgi:hypothetical protein